jgi:hypothetical protein
VFTESVRSNELLFFPLYSGFRTSYHSIIKLGGLSDFTVRGAARRHFSRQVAQHFSQEVPTVKECPIGLRSEHPIEGDRALFEFKSGRGWSIER